MRNQKKRNHMLKYSLLGIFLVAVTVVVHALGATAWLRHLGRKFDQISISSHSGQSLRFMLSTMLTLTTLHLVQIYIWAFAYMHLLPDSAFESTEEAIYFSFVTFTTLGYGDVTLSDVWRVLSGFEALSGVLLIGWSTAMLFAVVSRIWKGMLAETVVKN
jgi:voltage-gated potassium channel